MFSKTHAKSNSCIIYNGESKKPSKQSPVTQELNSSNIMKCSAAIKINVNQIYMHLYGKISHIFLSEKSSK